MEDGIVAELNEVCNELNSSIKDMNHFVKSLIRQMKSSAGFIKGGISLLDIKNDTLITYLINLVFFVLKKSSGERIESDTVIDRLVESRVVLEKIAPLEQKLKYQIEKLVKTSLTNEIDLSDKTRFKANPADMDDDGAVINDDETTGEDNISKSKKKTGGEYVPPKLASVPYDDDSLALKRQKLLDRAKKRALNSSVLQELKEEYLDTPVEITHTNTLRNTRLKFEEEKEKFEESYFTRLPVTKQEKRKHKLLNSFTLGQLGDDITRFEDISALEGSLTALERKHKKKRVSSSASKRKFKNKKKRKTM